MHGYRSRQHRLSPAAHLLGHQARRFRRIPRSRRTNQAPTWKKYAAESLARSRDQAGSRQYAVWWRRERFDDAGDMAALRAPFGDEPCTICGVDEHLWNGLNLRPPMMHFVEVPSLGVLVTDGDKPKLSFGLNDRPYAAESWFHTRHLVASVSFLGGLYGRDDFTLDPPYVPELNEFAGEWAYRRSGVLGTERNAHGAVPVVLTLQQLDTNLSIGMQPRSCSASLDPTPTRGQLPTSCEVDFVWLMPLAHPRPLGEHAALLGALRGAEGRRQRLAAA